MNLSLIKSTSICQCCGQQRQTSQFSQLDGTQNDRGYLDTDKSNNNVNYDSLTIELSVNLSYSQMHTSNVSDTVDWRNSIKSDHRKHSIRQLMQAVFSKPVTIFDKRMHGLFEEATKTEKNIYEMASSHSEYQRLLMEKVDRILKELGKNCQKQTEPQIQQPQIAHNQSGVTPLHPKQIGK